MTHSVVSPRAKIGGNVRIGNYTHIYDNLVIEDDSVIGDHCVIGHPAPGRWAGKTLRIGHGAIIRSHTVLYEGSDLGPKLETGHHALIREGTVAGMNLRVGSYTDIEGDCSLGDYCRFHSYVHIGKGSQIGNFVWLYSLTTLTNDPLPPSDALSPAVIEDGVVVCVGVVVLPGAILRKGSFVSANSIASGEIPEGGVVAGTDGKIVSHVSHLVDLENNIQHPWMGHFAHAYPEQTWPRLESLREDILAGREEFVKYRLGKRRRLRRLRRQ